MIALYRKFAVLDRADRRLVLEAASLMAFVWTGLRLLRFLTLRRILDYYVGFTATTTEPDPEAVHRVARSIAAIAARVPWATCLVRALAADVILRRTGLACELCIGVRVRDDREARLEAHAWVVSDGTVVVGSLEHLSDFTVLTALRSQ